MTERIRWTDEEIMQVAQKYAQMHSKEGAITASRIKRAQQVLPLERQRRWLKTAQSVGRIANYIRANYQALWPQGATLRPIGISMEGGVVTELATPEESWEPPEQKTPVEPTAVLEKIPTDQLIVEIERRRYQQFEAMNARLSQLSATIASLSLPASRIATIELPSFSKPKPELRPMRIVIIGLLNQQFRDLVAPYRDRVDFYFIDKDKSTDLASLPSSADLVVVALRFTSHRWIDPVRAWAKARGIRYDFLTGGFSEIRAKVSERVGRYAMNGKA